MFYPERYVCNPIREFGLIETLTRAERPHVGTCLSAPDDRMKYVMRLLDRIGREADKQGVYPNRLLGSQNRRHTRFNNIQERHALAIFQKETTRSATL